MIPGTEYVSPTQLRPGDRVVHYGVEFEIVGEPRVSTFHATPPGFVGPDRPVFTWATKLIWHPGNDLTAMPLSWAESWTFQGNDRARFCRLKQEA